MKRDEVCYTQEYMSKRLGIAQSTYQRIESGEINISLERLTKISAIFDKTIDDLLSGDKKKNKEDVESELECLRKIINRQEKYIVSLEEIIKLKNI